MTNRSTLSLRLLFADGLWVAAAAVVAFAAGALGDELLRNPPLGLHYRSAGQVAVEASEVRFIGIEEVGDLLGRPDVVVVDARPREIFDLGHLPGARSLSREQFAEAFATLEAMLRFPGQTIVVYCADVTCPDAAIVARSLRERGFANVLLFEGGYDEWEASGRPVEAAL